MDIPENYITYGELIGQKLTAIYIHDESIGDGVFANNVYFELENGLTFIAGYEYGVWRADLPKAARRMRHRDWKDLNHVIGQKITSIYIDRCDDGASDSGWLLLENGFGVTTLFSAPGEVGGGGVVCLLPEEFDEQVERYKLEIIELLANN